MSSKKRKKSIIVRILVLAVSVFVLTNFVGRWRELNTMQKEYEALQQQKIEMINKRDALQQLLEEGSHVEMIEKAAREKLGYVYPDEEVYVDISGN